MTITALPRDLVADTSNPNASARLASVGFAQACVQVRVVDKAGQNMAAGEVGEVVVAGDTVMKGYWRNHGATAKAIVGDRRFGIDGSGWFPDSDGPLEGRHYFWWH